MLNIHVAMNDGCEIPIFLITLYLLNKVYVYQSTCGEFSDFVSSPYLGAGQKFYIVCHYFT